MFGLKKKTGRASYKMSTSFQSLEKEGEDLFGSKAKKISCCTLSNLVSATGMSYFKMC